MIFGKDLYNNQIRIYFDIINTFGASGRLMSSKGVFSLNYPRQLFLYQP